jgi:hypothetical protein
VPQPPTDPLLHVTLQRAGAKRSWAIWRRSNRWECRQITSGSLSLFSYATLEEAMEQRARWEVEIKAASKDGWF